MPLESFVAYVTGAVLIIVGMAFLRRHRRGRRERLTDPTIAGEESAYYERQHRRRMWSSGLLVVLGGLIPIGYVLLTWRPALPVVVAIAYWIGVLLLVLVVLLLGVVDLFATGVHAKDAIRRVQREKAALERELEEVRRSLKNERR